MCVFLALLFEVCHLKCVKAMKAHLSSEPCLRCNEKCYLGQDPEGPPRPVTLLLACHEVFLTHEGSASLVEQECPLCLMSILHILLSLNLDNSVAT